MDPFPLIVIDVEIWSILAVSEVSEILTEKFTLTMTWQDPRVSFSNLKNDSYLNIVAPREFLRLWSPVVVFQNTQNMDQSLVIHKEICTG